MEYYLVYDTGTGEVLFRNSGPENSAYLQGEKPGRANFIVPYEIWDSAPLDMAGVKLLAAGRIDASAEALRTRYITTGSGQAMTYTEKADEAKAYSLDNTTPTPFLTAEADALGITVETLAAEVLARHAEWKIIGARIEGARMGAKAALSQAENLADIAAAMNVDWNALTD
jgi:hypothetical protein